MPDLTAKRTLVKSPPELWEELSEVDRLARHLDAFGEIRITKLEPEHTVAWEGEHASGTVSIEPAGWGTKVTLTAELPELEPEPPAPDRVAEEPVVEEPVVEEPVAEEPVAEEPVAEEPAAGEPVAEEPVAEEPVAEEPPAEEPAASVPAGPEPLAPKRRRGFWAWLFRERTAASPPFRVEPAPVPLPLPVHPEPVQPEPVEPEPVEPVVSEALEPPLVEPSPPEPAEPDPLPAAAAEAQTALDGALDSLGSAHHRPFSRG